MKSFFVCVKMENNAEKIRTVIFFKVVEKVGGQAVSQMGERYFYVYEK